MYYKQHDIDVGLGLLQNVQIVHLVHYIYEQNNITG